MNFEMVNIYSNWSISVGKVAGYLYIISLLMARYEITIGKERNYIYPLLVLLIIIITSSGVHFNIISSQILDMTLLQNIILYILFLIHEKNDKGVISEGIKYLSAGTVLLSSFFFLGIGVERSHGDEGRLSILGDNENMIGIRMVIAIIVFMYFINTSNKKVNIKNIIYVISIGFMIMVMRETVSRTASISLALAFIAAIYFYLATNKSISKIFYITILLTIISFVVLPFIMSNELLVERLEKVKGGDLANRDYLWKVFWEAILNSPYLGYGYSGYYMVSWQELGAISSPHNVILEVLLLGGMSGLIVFIIFNYYILSNAIKTYRNEKKYLGLLLLVPYAGMLAVGHTLGKKIMWYILAYNSIEVIRKKISNENTMYH
jgi:O-antigen ligase